jgi:hypothetical protein
MPAMLLPPVLQLFDPRSRLVCELDGHAARLAKRPKQAGYS